jgi:hypothetical protein
MVFSGFMLTGTNVKNQVILRTGDHYFYDISGEQNSIAVSGNETIDLGESITTSSRMGIGLPSMMIGQLTKYGQIGDWVCDHRIATTWGEKTVQMYLRVYNMTTIVLTDVGIDSSIIYRTSYLTPIGIIKSILTSSNNSDLPKADTRVSNDHHTGLSKVIDHLGTARLFLPTEGSWMYGSIEVSEGQSLSYNLTDSGGRLYFFTVQNLIDTSNDDRMHYQKDASLELGQPGMIGSQVPAGTYWFVLTIASASGGGFYPYWTTEIVS